jgi:ligand-binding sensor domain-containing protein/signal transduction histidine kinase/DNA-binding response OmpR family regulator
MRFYIKCIALAMGVLCAYTAYPQQITFNSLDIEDGLSQNSVLAIAQDKQGFIWLGTRAGLNKYDSYRLTVYKSQKNTKSLISSYITALLCDSKGRLWVGTAEGLNLYNYDGDNFSRVNLGTSAVKTESQNRINSIYEDRNGRIWVASEHDLHMILPALKGFKLVTVPLLYKGISLRSLLEDHTGKLWIGTVNGLYHLEEKEKRFVITRVPLARYGLSDLTNVHLLSMVEDPQRNIWLGTGGKGLIEIKYDGSTQRYKTINSVGLADNNVRRLLLDGKGNLWVGTQGGVSVMSLGDKTIATYKNEPWDEHSLSQNSVHSLYKDSLGNILIGTFFGGVNSYSPYATPFTVFNNKSRAYRLNNNVISSVIEDEKGNYWIGTEGGGVNYIDKKRGAVQYYLNDPEDKSSIGSNLVKTIYRDHQNNIWIGTHAGGLNLFNKSTGKFIRYLNDKQMTLGSEITCILQDHSGKLWIGTETAGLNVFHYVNNQLKPVAEQPVIPTESKAILAVIETSQHKVWAGTRQGLYIIKGRNVKHIKTAPTGSTIIANCLFEQTDGSIWAGTDDNGLLKFNRQGTCTANFNTNHGLADSKVLGILAHGNELWISTGNGLSRLNLKSKKFINYTEADGLAGNVFNNNSYYKSANGQVFFGGYKGLTTFRPNQIPVNKQAPVVRFVNLKLANKVVKAGGDEGILPQNMSGTNQLSLNYNQNVFTIDFAALSFIKPGKNKYKYLLSGYDKSWQDAIVPSATYTNVPPGNYTFYAKGANNDNIWSNSTVLKITILPPFWKTWWAYAIYAALFIGIVILIIRYFVLKAMYQKNQEITQFKLNFFTNISHEIRTHLSLILGPAERLLAEKDNDPGDERHLLSIKNNSESLLQLVNELMDFRKAEAGRLTLHVGYYDIVPFIHAVHASFHDLALSKNITSAINTTSDAIDLYFDKEQLEKVFYNLIYNGYKFSPAGSSLSITIKNAPEFVEIEVANFGKGISAHNIPKVFDNYYQEAGNEDKHEGYGIGLALSKSIIDLHGGSISVQSEFEKSFQTNKTSFLVRLYKGKEHLKHCSFLDKINVPDLIPADDANLDSAIIQPLQSATSANKPLILVVEDNLSIRSFIKECLQRLYDVQEANNGKEGMEVAISIIPDIIITDVMMPEMDGLAFCSQIKSDERTSHIPVVMLTAKNGVQQHINGLQNGADIYLTKPFSTQLLLLQVKNILTARELTWQRLRARFKAADESITDVAVATPVALHPVDEAFLNKITFFVEENLSDGSFGVGTLSKMAGMSQPVLLKKIKAVTGLSANDFVKNLRLKKAAGLLSANRYNVSEVAYMVGYESTKYFSREFKKHYNVNPSEYKLSAVNSHHPA